MQRRVIVVWLAMLALGVASCGGSKGTSTAYFTKRGNAICTKAMKQVRQGMTHGGTVEEQFVRLQHTKIDKLGGLTPPDGLDGVYAQYKHLLSQRLNAIQRAFAVFTGDSNAAEKHHWREQIYQLRVAETTLADALGLKSCDEVSY